MGGVVFNPANYPLNSLTCSAVSLTTSSATAIAANADRKYLLLINDAAQAVYIQPSTVVVTAQTGIRINANGGSWESSRGLGNLYCGQILVMSTAATGVLLVAEGV